MSDPKPQPHVALLPSSGMGHLTPFFRLAALLTTKYNCRVTFITTSQTVSLAESNSIASFLSAFPEIIPINFNLLPFDSTTANSTDPFFLQFEAISRSAHLIAPLLASSSLPVSALIIDVTLAASFVPATADLHLPRYILFTSSAKMLSLCAYFPAAAAVSESSEDSDIFRDGICINDSLVIPKSWLPLPLLDLTNLFTTQFIANGEKLLHSDGILISTLDDLERDTLGELNAGKIVNGLPPVIPIGPLTPCDFERGNGTQLSWLDDQAENSVVYISFGSRTSLPRNQIRELGDGLLKSGHKFLWVIKDMKVDKDDEDGVEEIVGYEFIEKAKDYGLVVKTWVDQFGILSHPAVGGFVTHCGWNSVTEAALCGVPMLAWPQGGDQRVNAKVIESGGMGLWVESWGWGGELVKGNEIGMKIKELMEDEGLRVRAAHVKKEARKVGKHVGGGAHKLGFLEIIEGWK
ncbi:hypothetical protein GIB67_042661 [Kingdonia uniflora]|uniref:Glycosyltransferase n=1 Tax=Kingdonia uniflora TaxID=39325 RepID=A0A7J7P271_9MAGN|nr:hypothetical protein GIB67_042661 [Kingdonia uniflora]